MEGRGGGGIFGMRLHTDLRAALTEGQAEETWLTPNEAMVF